MFWDNFLFYCNQKGVSPNAAASDVGVKSSGTVTGWKNGAIPRKAVLKRLADYFEITIEDLTGEQNEKSPAKKSEGHTSKDDRLIKWFRSLPLEKQRAILISQDGPTDAV